MLRTARKEAPNVTMMVAPVEGQPQWLKLTIRVESRTNHGYRGGEMTMIRPRSAKLLTDAEARSRQDGVGNHILADPLPLEVATPTKALRLAIQAHGAGRTPFSFGDTGYADAYLAAPPSWKPKRDEKIVLSISLLSMEPRERTTIVRVVRRVPAEIISSRS
jgi:hypothetical protein